VSGGAITQREAPALAVVVPSRARALRVRWLLNELETQTLPPERFEVLVAHPAGDPALEAVARHPLGQTGRARSVAVAPGAGRAAARNAGWRAARAPLVVFTHDDCRPPAEWLEEVLTFAGRAPGAPVQGAVVPDPEQDAYQFARLKRVRRSRPPDPFGPACNLAVPRAELDRLGGFDEAAEAEWLDGAELAAQVRATGAEVLAAPDLRVFHAIRPVAPIEWLRETLAVGGLPAALRRTPSLRDGLVLGVAVRRSHLLALAALAGAAAARRRPAALALALPWLGALALDQREPGGGLGRALARLPLRATRDLMEVGALAVGSARARSLCL
jgi:GT2 family glycosyltransferase